MTKSISRRRFFSITASVAGAATLGLGGFPARASDGLRWQGVCMGSMANLDIVHPDKALTRALITKALAEVHRLESQFSLFKAESALCRLNETGRLNRPSIDMVRLLGRALLIAEQSGGAFDPTVQPLFQLYKSHFAGADADPNGPPTEAVGVCLQQTGWQGVTVTESAIFFDRPGMALTLNGIAQGYITDRVADIFQREGFDNLLINMGEARLLGQSRRGDGWRIALPSGAHVAVADGAVATSEPSGYLFDPNGRFHHLLNSNLGEPALAASPVSVLAERATDADAWSTALSVMEPDRRQVMLRTQPGLKILR